MTVSERRKGIVGEREVRKLLEAAGWTVRGLEGEGDNLARTPTGVWVHVETKRQERLRVPQWIKQVEDEAPAELAWLLCFRQSRGRWFGVAPLDVLVELIL